MDKIILSNIQVMGKHGVNPVEKLVKQPFSIDVALYTDLSAAAASDDLADTLDYAQLYCKIRSFVEDNSFQLLETLTSRLASMILEDKRITKVRIRVEKSQARLDNMVFPAAIEMERKQRPEDR